MSIETSSKDKKTSAAVLSDLQHNHKILVDTILIKSNHCGVLTLIACIALDYFVQHPVIQMLPRCNSPWKTVSLTFRRRPRRSTLLDGFGLLDAGVAVSTAAATKYYKVHTQFYIALSHVQAILRKSLARAVLEHSRNILGTSSPTSVPTNLCPTYWSPPASFGDMTLIAHPVWRSCPESGSSNASLG